MEFKRLTDPFQIDLLLAFHNENSRFVVVDVETDSVSPRKAKLLDVQINGETVDSAVIFSADWAYKLALLNPNVVLVAHNYKYDAHVLFRHGIDLLDRIWRDTLLIGHLLDENRESYSLDSYVKENWNDPYKEEFWKKYKSYQEATEQDKIRYACADVVYTGKLYRGFLERLCSGGDIPDSLVSHVHRLQNSLLYTEIRGIGVDLEYLQDLAVKIKYRIDELEPKMRGCVKDEIEIIELQSWSEEIEEKKSDKGKAAVCRPLFSFESPKQLRNLLFSSLRLPVQRNEKTKAVSTDYASLEKLRKSHPVIELIQENRELQKVYTAYVKGTLDRVDQQRIYPEFRVAGPVTGRISHNNPNLAQLPKTGGVRGIYVPDPGRVLISADYNQLEVVLEADLTGDKNLLRMLENGESKHDLTARELGCSRDTAKTLNFALQYWASHYKVAKLLGVSLDEGLRIYNKYWEVYKGPKDLKAKTDRMVDEGIPLKTCFGRKRRFEIRKRNVWDSDYRQAYNFLIQSTGADLTNRAFYLVAERLRETGMGRGLFTVHDELIIEVEQDKAAIVESIISDFMSTVGVEAGLKIPLKAQTSGPMLRWEE